MAVLLTYVFFCNDQGLEGKCGPHPDTNPQVKIEQRPFFTGSSALPDAPRRAGAAPLFSRPKEE